MSKRTPSSLSDYWEVALRRCWWVLVPAVLISVGTFFGSLWLPRSYRSEATIMVEPQKVPSNYVQSTISADVGDRLQNIREEILSRTRLYKVITEFNLYGASRRAMSTDDMVEEMRNNIAVEIVNDPKNSDRSRTVAAFKISYTGRTPSLVQQVTRKLTSLFIEENLRKREQDAEGTTDFLEGELEKMRQSLQEQEIRIQTFKSAHAGELPEQQVPTLQMLGQFQSVLQANSDAITRAMQQKNFLDLVLESMQAASTPQNMKSVLQLQYDAKSAELISAQQRYKGDHPDIIRLLAELKALKGQLAAEDKNWTGDGRALQHRRSCGRNWQACLPRSPSGTRAKCNWRGRCSNCRPTWRRCPGWSSNYRS